MVVLKSKTNKSSRNIQHIDLYMYMYMHVDIEGEIIIIWANKIILYTCIYIL